MIMFPRSLLITYNAILLNFILLTKSTFDETRTEHFPVVVSI